MNECVPVFCYIEAESWLIKFNPVDQDCSSIHINSSMVSEAVLKQPDCNSAHTVCAVCKVTAMFFAEQEGAS